MGARERRAAAMPILIMGALSAAVVAVVAWAFHPEAYWRPLLAGGVVFTAWTFLALADSATTDEKGNV